MPCRPRRNTWACWDAGEKDSDDSLRLGFQIHGFLNQPSDVDVYSFKAPGGTEVWLDIDRTTSSLDSVVELIDANGARAGPQ